MITERTVTFNDTTSYHINELDTLGWELTVCNALEPVDSPIRKILVKNAAFGVLLHDYLSTIIPMERVRNILEVGGGYGFLMRDFLAKRPEMKASMLDISPYLLERQKQTLSGLPVTFLQQNFFKAAPLFLSGFDLAVLNENIGDFPTICGLSADILRDDDYCKPIAETRRLIAEYGLPVPDGEFSVNLGALQAVENICMAGIPYVYISEHSCEASVPQTLQNVIDISPSNSPERIALKGHDEYTIMFSHIECIATKFNYRIKRGNYTDFISYVHDGLVNFILTSQTQKDEHEIIRLFIGDLYKYEYLVLCGR